MMTPGASPGGSLNDEGADRGRIGYVVGAPWISFGRDPKEPLWLGVLGVLGAVDTHRTDRASRMTHDERDRR
jgi:hypothetical protein